MRRGGIFRRFLILMLFVIIFPMVFVYSLVSSVFIEKLHDNYKKSVHLSAYIATQSIKEAISSVIDISVSIIGDTRVHEFLSYKNSDGYLSRYNSAQSALNRYCLDNNYISQIYVTSISGDKTITVGAAGTYHFTEEEKERMLMSSGAWFWSREENGRIAVCRLIRNVDNNEEKLGFIKIIFNEGNLIKQLYVNEAETQYTYAIIDINEQKIVLTTDDAKDDIVLRVFEEQTIDSKNDDEYVAQDDNQYLVYSRITINTRPCYLVVAAADQTLYYSMLRYGVIFLIVILFVVFCSLYAALYRKNIALPLETLGRRMRLLKPDSGTTELLTIKAEGEVKELVDSFNKMAVKLDYLYQINYKKELQLRNTNLLILQSEINPHFFYNVLDSIRWMIELGEKEAASGMVQKLSEMFRLTLSSSEKSRVRLKKELEHLEKYIALEKYRFGDKIRFDINIQENLKDPLTVKFILQPLVENAIVHGIAKKKGYGNIVISIYVSEQTLIYDIRDDGCGADPERINEILNQKLKKENSLEGFALENIQDRLQMRYGKKYGITYKVREEGGSIFTVKQPLIYEEEEQDNA